MQLSLNAGMYQRLEQSQRLKQGQKLQLKQLLELSQKLVLPEFPNPTTGMEGLRVAHKILQEKEACGILIGGVLKAVLKYRNLMYINSRKDVDVMVFNEGVEFNDFEGGIDWWLPQSAGIRAMTDASTIDVNVKWWKNANNIVLSFGIDGVFKREWYRTEEEFQSKEFYKPGLYIADKGFFEKMKQEELKANIDSRVCVDKVVFDRFNSEISKGLHYHPDRSIEDKFTFKHEFGSFPFEITPIPREYLIAIRNGKFI